MSITRKSFGRQQVRTVTAREPWIRRLSGWQLAGFQLAIVAGVILVMNTLPKPEPTAGHAETASAATAPSAPDTQTGGWRSEADDSDLVAAARAAIRSQGYWCDGLVELGQRPSRSPGEIHVVVICEDANRAEIYDTFTRNGRASVFPA